LNIALAHHWLVRMRGGERVLEQLCLLFEAAPIYTLVARPGTTSALIESHPIVQSKLSRLPFADTKYRQMLPLFPWAVRTLHVNGAIDLLVSSDASVIKGLSYREGIPHICYCHSPPRYLWDEQDTYLRYTSGLPLGGRAFFRAVSRYVREFDRRAAQRVTHFIANSEFVRSRIARCYGREADVIHPPVDTGAFTPRKEREEFYLIVSELVAYKRVDLAVQAFSRNGKPLVIIGDGPERAHLTQLARKNVRFLGRQRRAEIIRYFERCRGLIHPQVEDFGITAVEAQAAGAPVIALHRGGACETVLDTITGLFFEEATVSALCDALERFENLNFDPLRCAQNAHRFRPDVFVTNFREMLARQMPKLFARASLP
jgi:glycosyltransferase involved in cell wall biosynthesis